MVISSTVFTVGYGGVPGYGGLEVIAWHTARGLAEKGHQVTLIAPDNSTCPDVEVIQTGPAGKHNEEMAFNIYWPKLLEVDVVIDSSWLKSSVLLKMEGRLKAPVLCVMHAPVNTMWGKPPPIEKPCVVCISEDQRRHFEGLFDPLKARTCYNGIDLDYYTPIDCKRSERFLFLARFSSIKGPDLALEAAKEVGAGLDLIGDTFITNEPEFYHRCASLCDGSQLKMIGSASRGECVWWMSQVHCLLHPNLRFREPLGLAPLEAQACGTPCIAFDNGAMRETIYHCENFENLVKNMDEFKQAMRVAMRPDGITYRDRMGCRNYAAMFSIEKMVNRYNELCEEAVITGGW
jgi:glycosyltransferase involved in cell wall biosynthesis